MENSLLFYYVCLIWCCFYIDFYKVHINCGGNAINVGNIKYEADDDPAGGASFFQKENWGFSSSGRFWDLDTSGNDYLANNASILKMNESELYTSARLSPLSITYYARCLANGPYKLKLHFAEIVIRDNRSFGSLGRRIFDIYVQVFCQIYLYLYIRVEVLIELICCRKNWCWKILILKMLH